MTAATFPFISFRREQTHRAAGLLVAAGTASAPIEVRVYRDGVFGLLDCAGCGGVGNVAVPNDEVHCRSCAGHGRVLVRVDQEAV